jgi:hypothetical protein
MGVCRERSAQSGSARTDDDDVGLVIQVRADSKTFDDDITSGSEESIRSSGRRAFMPLAPPLPLTHYIALSRDPKELRFT